MKKIISFVLVAIMAISAFALVACEAENEKFKIGLGTYSVVSDVVNATATATGKATITVNVAAITVNSENKVVDCVLDTADHTVEFTADGKAVAIAPPFQTKYEKGDSYNMVAWGGAAKEWFEQADIFAGCAKGKTLAEIKALAATGDAKQGDITAGCTIDVNGFVLAIDKAFSNLADSNADADCTLKLGISTSQSCTDATATSAGSNELETTIFAAAVGADGKVVAASSDCVVVSIGFDATGVSNYNTSTAIISKKDQKESYNMVAWGGATKEWFEQAAAFDAACLGKNATEIAALMVDGYAPENSDLYKAGCTIAISGFVKAATKIG